MSERKKERKKEVLVCIVHSKESSLAMLADLNFYCKNTLNMNNILSITLESYVDRILTEINAFW